MRQTHNTLAEPIRQQSVQLLNRHLAACIDLHAQVKQAHWNVRGPGFIAIHMLFDTVAAKIETISDDIAERAASLGAMAQGTVTVAAANSFLLPYTLGLGDEQKHSFAVSSALAAFGQSTREAIKLTTGFGDPVTADLFTQITGTIDRQLWFIESHIARD